MSTNNRSSRRQVKLPMKFNDHVMANSSQRDGLNRSKEMNLNVNSQGEINIDLEKVRDKNEVLSEMDDRGVDDCSRSNGSRNEMNSEEQNVMKSIQETPIKSHAVKNVEISSRVSGSPEIEVKIINVPLEAWCLEGISALASSLGRPILMDSMTTMMCHKGVGNLRYARVLMEMEAIKELKMEIEIQYMDKEKNIKGSKKVQVKYDWKPLVCTHCKVFRHGSKQCNKRSNADKGKLDDDDDYNHSKERNNVVGNCGENQHRNDGFGMQNRRRMYNKDPSKKGNPLIARNTANNVRHNNSLNKGGVNMIHNNEPWQEYRKKHGETEKLEKKKENSGATKNKWNVNGKVVKDLRNTANKYLIFESLPVDNDQELQMLKERMIADDSENFEDVCCDQDGIKKVMEENETRAGNMTGIIKKLDRVMINEDFIKQYPQAHAKFIPYVISDYTHDILCIPTSIKKIVKPFRFSNFLTNKQEFIDIVKEKWRLEVPGYFMYQVVMKLKSIKCPLNKLSWSKGNLFKRVETLRGQLQEVQTKIDQDPHNPLLRDKKAGLIADIYKAEKDEEKFLYKQARIKWLNEGDKNSSYFHKVLKGRSNKSIVFSLYDDTGLIHEGDQIPQLFLKHFEVFLGTSQKNAIFDIDGFKAPGPDGFTADFFKKDWGIIGNDICKAVRELFKNGIMLGQLNATIVSLIPKIQTPSKENRPKRVAFKIDLQKAYDTISWDFLKSTLEGFGFHERMIQWIMECVTTAALTLNVNGERVGLKEVDKNFITSVFPFSIRIFPVKYLGVPLIAKRLGIKECGCLLDKIKCRTKNWRNRSLTYAGRLQLIAAILESIHLKGKPKLLGAKLTDQRTKEGYA
nr:hypothetical protein [Tanacetum cinerariifolium]